jgi:hypothetical protein
LAAPVLAADLPAALTYRGAPLDPYCLADFHEEPTVALAECTADPAIVRLKAEAPLAADAKGWIGYAFKYADMADLPPRAWAAWRYLGEVDRGLVVETLFSGGGTGWFSAVHLVRREEGDRLRIVDTLAGGDRCNGGIEGAAVVAGRVVTASRMTPDDLMAWALEQAGGPLPEDTGLAFCAICCVATATYVDSEPAWVAMGPLTEGFAQAEDDQPQACFDALVGERADPGTIFDLPALAALGRAYRERCMP